MKIVGVIPARYKSSRFPGKPLADICGKPMIWWVYQEALKVKEFSEVVIATEDERVKKICDELNMNCMITSDIHPTGTDRVAEVANKIEADAVMLIEKFTNPVDVINTTTIKLAVNENGNLIFMSRTPIPYPKAELEYSYFKNVGCYAMKKDTLDFFLKTKPGRLERAEEIELLRLLENGKTVITVEINSKSMAVDTQKDLERIRKIISEQLERG